MQKNVIWIVLLAYALHVNAQKTEQLCGHAANADKIKKLLRFLDVIGIALRAYVLHVKLRPNRIKLGHAVNAAENKKKLRSRREIGNVLPGSAPHANLTRFPNIQTLYR